MAELSEQKPVLGPPQDARASETSSDEETAALASDEASEDMEATEDGEGGPGPVETVRRKARKKKPRPMGRCDVTGREVPKRDLFPVALLRPAIADRLREDYPDLPAEAKIWRRKLDELRTRYIGAILGEERGQLSALEQEVVNSLEHHETVSENIEQEFETHRSFGERVSDHLATFGGSWAFLISFGVMLLVWMGYNAFAGGRAFDEYPFILLNLVLSCLAAIQAPIIMMSQKRQESKDRLRALSDYQVNLKAELEIRHLHEKVDHILKSQWERLAEMQEMQLDLLQELDRRSAKRR
jgi:uncharacterized membrane protein